MRALSVILVCSLLASCVKDDEPNAVIVGSSTPHFTVEDVTGTYYGRYAYYSSASYPGGTSYSFIDTMFLQVRADTTEPISPNWVFVGPDPFILHEDGTLDCNWNYGGQSYCYGAFTIVNDTIRVECERINQMDYSSTRSTFSGVKQ